MPSPHNSFWVILPSIQLFSLSSLFLDLIFWVMLRSMGSPRSSFMSGRNNQVISCVCSLNCEPQEDRYKHSRKGNNRPHLWGLTRSYKKLNRWVQKFRGWLDDSKSLLLLASGTKGKGENQVPQKAWDKKHWKEITDKQTSRDLCTDSFSLQLMHQKVRKKINNTT